ncbi:hypothetical protein PR048_019525 [Dryococelus australis]|uniref:Uncharacterized protein n=1 Tax=Dryococelus australis TaxID=614101 RepID=A0ABQ9H3T7_9NEOP|nr:hypothetical protein PR048_019525 [Dryococelus australis]
MVNSMTKTEPTQKSIRKLRVCKTFFLNTLGVSERYAYTAWDKLDELDIVGPDNCGKHSNHILKMRLYYKGLAVT